MGAIGLFLSIVSRLAANPRSGCADTLEEIAAGYERYAYIGNRRQLQQLVVAQSEVIHNRLFALPARDIADLGKANRELGQTVTRLRKAKVGGPEVAAAWFGRDWKKNSGLFPDFVLAWDKPPTYGNGALVELKDTEGNAIASFNSTIPTRRKSLNEVSELTGSTLVSRAVMLRDAPHVMSADLPRMCFYLVRTHGSDAENVRISVVEGSFFETVPKGELLMEVWRQLLEASGLPKDTREAAAKALGDLNQGMIVQSRTVPKASVRPRLRLMAEAHADANPHNYVEIPAKAVSLVAKRDWGDDWRWLAEQFDAEGICMRKMADDLLEVLPRSRKRVLRIRLGRIQHKRNGPHLVLQHRLGLR